jgi:cytochrome P450
MNDPAICRVESGSYVVAAYTPVLDVLRSDTRFSSRQALGPREVGRLIGGTTVRLSPELSHYLTLPSSIVCADGSEHRRLRRIARHGPTSDAAKRFAPAISAICRQFVERTHSRALPWPTTMNAARRAVTATLAATLGVAEKDYSSFAEWVDLITHISRSGHADDTGLLAHADGAAELSAYLERRVDALRCRHDDSILSAMVRSAPQTPAGVADVLRICHALVVAAHEPTATMLASIVRLLTVENTLTAAEHGGRPRWAITLTEEILRCHSPVSAVYRTALFPTIVAGLRIPRGGHLRLCLATANRDPTTFGQPDQIDLSLEPRPTHLAFGYGAHSCVGAPLARAMGRTTALLIADRAYRPL